MAKNELINRVIVESSEGDRAFLLLEGDIFSEQADIYIFNTYKNDSGMLIEKLKEQYQENIPVTPFYYAVDGTRVGKVTLENGRMILILHTDLVEHEQLTTEKYKSLLHTVFASLTALESYGEKFETVAFPVLFRNGLDTNHTDVIRILIEKSTEWLKVSDYTKVMKYVLFESGDAELWNEKLNRVLGRSVMNIDEFSDLRQYKNKALSIIQQIDRRFSFWEDTILPIRNALQRKDFRPEVVAAFSRKLLEVYCHEQGKVDANHDGSLDGYLTYMRKNNLLHVWDMQTLYQIRSFGNPSIHRPDPVIGPIVMNEKDVTIQLIVLCKLLELLYEFVSANQSFSLK